MRYIPRLIESEIREASKAFSSILLTGPRRAGKTTLLKKMFPGASYYLLEDPDIISRVRADARVFLKEIKTPAILDEIQNVPDLFNYLRSLMDQSKKRYGQWLLTGSQEASLMKGVSESMSGRAALFSLLPLSIEETPKTTLLGGGFPEVIAHPKTASTWFRSYLQTYLERDVRSISAIKDLSQFRRFLALLASRTGHMLNKTEFAAPLGVSVPTISEWLNILEITNQIFLVPPFYENFGKRLIKSPKLYFSDTGLLCHLLGIDSKKKLEHSSSLGVLFENFSAAEIIKHQINMGRRQELYYFRDQQGLEIDFIIPHGDRKLILVEVKSTSTVKPPMAKPLKQLTNTIKRYHTSNYVIYRPLGLSLNALAPKVQAISLKGFLRDILKSKVRS